MFGLRPDAAAGRGACACASCNACERASVMPAARAIAELPPSSIERRLRPPRFVFSLISHALRRASNWISLLNARMCALTIQFRRNWVSMAACLPPGRVSASQIHPSATIAEACKNLNLGTGREAASGRIDQLDCRRAYVRNRRYSGIGMRSPECVLLPPQQPLSMDGGPIHLGGEVQFPILPGGDSHG